MAKPATEKTVAQVITKANDKGELPPPAMNATLFDNVKKHPSVTIVRAFAVAPILSINWGVIVKQDAPPAAKQLIEDYILPLKNQYLMGAALGTYDWGFQPWEKIGEVDEKGQYYIKKLKPLSQDKTLIMVDPSGAITGLKNYPGTEQEVILPVEDCLINYINVEGTNWYGNGYLERQAKVYNWWNLTNDAALRYDKKIAGAHWVVYYPEGKSNINGVEKPNSQVADELLTSLESTGCIAVPAAVAATLGGLNNEKTGWQIEIKAAYPTSGVAFGDRLMYLDALFARAAEVSERAVFQSQYGTKAEAGVQGDFSVTNVEIRAAGFIDQFNRYVVDKVLEANYGPQAKGSVRIEVSGVSNAKRAQLLEVFKQLMIDPTIRASFLNLIDLKPILDIMDVPTIEDALPATTSPANTGGVDLTKQVGVN